MDVKQELLKALLQTSYTPLLSESGSSDSEEEYNLFAITDSKQKKSNIERIKLYIENVVHAYNDDVFKKHFRMGRQTAYTLIKWLEESDLLPSHTRGREKINAEKAFLLTIWYLSNQETFRQVSDRFNITRSSAWRTLKRVLKYLVSLKNKYIKWPTGSKIQEINNGFKKFHGIDKIIGAIDGSHIEICKPQRNQDAYINRKGYHSLLLQVVVDHEKYFLDVFCGEPGSMHDARLLRKSGLFKKITENPTFMQGCFIVGDTAYPNLPWLVTPFKDAGYLSHQQQMFNYRISATRVVVENAFGLLKCRFRRLRKLDNLNIKTCSEIIMATCVLHNICSLDKDELDMQDSQDYNQPEPVPEHNIAIVNRREEVFSEMSEDV